MIKVMAKIPLIKIPGTISNWASWAASTAGKIATTAARPVLDRFVKAGDRGDGIVKPEDMRPPPALNPDNLETSLAQFDKPKMISSSMQLRPPTPYFTWVNWEGKAYETYVRHTHMESLMDALDWHGTIERHGDHYLFKLRDGRKIRFNFTEGRTGKVLRDIDFSSVGKETAKTLPLAQKFLDILEEEGLVGAVFGRNQYYKQEKAAYKRWHSDPEIVDLPKVGLRDLLIESWDWDVLVIPDIHNHWDEIELIEEMLDRGRLDWMAMEMFRASFQRTIDQFLSAPGGTGSYSVLRKEMRRELIEGIRLLRLDLKRGWDTWLTDLDLPVSPYFRLMVSCRDRDMRLYGLNCERDYIMLNYSERERVPWIMGAENKLWAQRIPIEGRGIVFGGLMHFSRFPGVRVQDFMVERMPDKRIVEVSFRK